MGKNTRKLNTKTQAVSFRLDVYAVLETVRTASVPKIPRSTFINNTLAERFALDGLMEAGPAPGKSALSAALDAATKMPARPDGEVVKWLAGHPDVANWLFRFMLERGVIKFDPGRKRWHGAAA
jgi:hypothetical protein